MTACESCKAPAWPGSKWCPVCLDAACRGELDVLAPPVVFEASPVVEVDPWDLPDEPVEVATDTSFDPSGGPEEYARRVAMFEHARAHATDDEAVMRDAGCACGNAGADCSCVSFDFGHSRFDRLRNEINGARTLRELRAVGDQIASAADTDEALVPGMRAALRGIYADRLRTLRGPELPVWPDRYAKGWPASDTGRATMTPLAGILTTAYATDAHFAPYRSPQLCRLRKEAVGKVAIDMVALVVDVDTHDEGRSPAWDAALREGAARLPGDPYGYFTRGGARLVWKLPQPFAIGSVEDAASWTRIYCLALVDVFALSGIVPDPACRAWPWMFRAPMATREGVPQRHPVVCGDVNAIGAWPWPDIGDVARRRAVRQTRQVWGDDVFNIVAPKARPPAPARTLITRQRGGAKGALAHAVRKVRDSVDGTRNTVLYAQAKWLAEVASEGRLRWEQAAEALTDAALAAGLEPGEVRSTIASAAGQA